MEIFQAIWAALTTPNEELINIISIPFIFIEATVAMLILPITILNIHCSWKQKVLYVLIISVLQFLLDLPLFHNITTFIMALLWPIIAMLTLKTNFFKSVFMEIIPFISIAILEPILVQFLRFCFGILYTDISSVPIYRIAFVSLMYISLFLISLLAKRLNFNITLLDNMNKKNKRILLINFIFGIFSIIIQLYLSNIYNDLPLITLFGTVSLLIYFFISMYSLLRTTRLEITEQSLEEAQLYNKSLKILHDNVRAFKHDFSNIVQAIGRLYWK